MCVYIRFYSKKAWETAFRGYNIAQAYIKKIEENSKNDGGNLNPNDRQVMCKCRCNSRQYKEECEKFAKIAEHLVKVVYSVNSRGFNAWNERKHFFDEENMNMEQFSQQFDNL